MKFYLAILLHCGLFFIFQTSSGVNLIGSTKVKRGWNKYGWVLGAPSLCSASCGEGVQTSRYQCRVMTNNNPVPGYYCIHSKMPDPVVKVCNSVPCQPVWLVSDWSSCNATCGFGMKTRSVRCGMKGSDGKPSFVQDNFCIGLKPNDKKMCNQQMCRHWRSEEWGKCSVTCGHGHSYRKVKCVAENITLCPYSKKPKEKKICYQGPCLGIEIDVLPNNGENKKTEDEELKLQLYDIDDEETRLILEDYEKGEDKDDEYGDYEKEFRKKFNSGISENSGKEDSLIEKIDETSEETNNQTEIEATTPTVTSPSHTEVEKTAIKNYRYIQKIQCDGCSISLMIADEETIVYLPNNATLNLICHNEDDETLLWYRNDAVVSRKQIFQLRRVTPLDSGIYICFRNSRVSKVAVSVIAQILDVQNVGKQSKEKFLSPYEPLNLMPTSNFNQQFPLHYGVMYPPPYTISNYFLQQEIICSVSTNLFFMLLDVSLCDEDKANIVKFILGDIPSYKWEHTDWSECSAECVGNGVGKRSREVWCQSPAGHRVDEHHCKDNGQVEIIAEIHCPKEACLPHWKAGPYSKCEGICGRYGQMNREVGCMWGADVEVDERMCDSMDKPVESIKCRLDCSHLDMSVDICVDKVECREIDPAEKCSEKNIKFCCETCHN